MTSFLMDLNHLRKNKVVLSDYDYEKDIVNRLLMSQFSSTDIEVLEEILYSSLQIPVSKMAKNLESEENIVIDSLDKLSKTGLLKVENSQVIVDKEMRKYFETQIQKFDEDFVPGMDFLQSLLRKVPIHNLPVWYSIPRTSNNIFESIIEKYLQTPQIFQRYLMELTFNEPVLKNIVDDVYNSDDLEVSAEELINKYNLTKEMFEEYMLILEFNFVCCLGYKRIGNQWHEKVTPFHEWKEYVTFIRDTETAPISPSTLVVPKRNADYSFVQDLGALLEKAKKQPIILERSDAGFLIPQRKIMQTLASALSIDSMHDEELDCYFHHLITKAQLSKLADVSEKKLSLNDKALEWLEMRLESRAMYLYRHPLNRPLFLGESEGVYNEKSLREAEKSIFRAIQKEWVFFDDFMKGVYAPLHEDSIVSLKRYGRVWKYALPEYQPNDVLFLKQIIFYWLFEAGLVQVGKADGRDCFRVTSLGCSLFAR